MLQPVNPMPSHVHELMGPWGAREPDGAVIRITSTALDKPVTARACTKVWDVACYGGFLMAREPWSGKHRLPGIEDEVVRQAKA